MSEKIIMENSNEAATYRTDISGWVDRNGKYYGKDEMAARYSGSTHSLCECGEIINSRRPIGYRTCTNCRDKRDAENYNKKEKKVWDKCSFIYSQKYDEYFDRIDGLEYFLNDYKHEVRPEIKNMMLVHCNPQYLNEIDSDHWRDLMSDECELSDEIIEALDDLNDIIQGHEPVSWVPGNIAVEDFEVNL